ncbi:MAG: phosphate acyltransferase [Eubacteriales bacterium]|nr:phosphate acyltransferase [Eubacteriales bacterium]
MAYKNFYDLINNINDNKMKKVVAVAAANDERVLDAVFKAHEDGVLDYILIGNKASILEKGEALFHSTEDADIVEASNDRDAAFKAVELIRNGKADFLMKGNMETGILLKEVVNKETGIGKGRIMSHMCIMEIPAYHKLMGFTDGGMIINPTLEEKIGIIENALELFRHLSVGSPKIAAVTAIETVNPKMIDTVDAAELKKMSLEGKFGDCYIEGPISCDLTFSKEAAAIKDFESPVTGDADIMLVPNVVTGNILNKALIYLAGAKMAGCILGAKTPIVLPSRGSTFEEKYYSLVICATQFS